MLSNHLCVETCFAARTSEKFIINCFLCDKRFNSKCFDLSSQQKLLTSPNNAIFMCYKCIERVSKIKHNHRKSNEKLSSSTTNDNTLRNGPNSTNNEDDVVSLLTISSMLKKMEIDIKKVSTSNDEIKQHVLGDSHSSTYDNITTELSSINKNFINLQAKIDHNENKRSATESQSTSTIIDKLIRVDNMIQTATPASKKPSVFLGTDPSKQQNNKTLSVDPLDWSFSFNQQTTQKETSDLYHLLHGFEQNTWTSFDYVSRMLKDNTDIVDQMKSSLNDLYQRYYIRLNL